jgi:Rrf2 family iron-sulfur cluster assembly transcriptional regulator
MKLTTKGRFAVSAILDIALHQKKSPVTLLAVSERQSISLSYLEQLFSKLRKREIVSSTRGPGGGYKINKAFTSISVKDIISAVDEKIDATQCGGTENCHDGSRCMTHDLWISVNNKILSYLDSLSLQDLYDNYQINRAENKDQKIDFFEKNNVNESGVRI